MNNPPKNLPENILENLSCQVLFDTVADAMLLVDVGGRVVQANQAAQQLLEYSQETICGLEVEALMPASYRTQHHQYREIYSQHPEKRPMGNGRNLFALSGSGKKIAVNISLSPLQIQEQAYILITLSTNKRRKAEQALRASEERLQLAKSSAGLGIFDFDATKNIVHWDERMCELWGAKSDKTISYEKFVAAIHPDDRAARQDALILATDSTGNGEYSAEFRIINAKDGVEHWIATTGRMHFENGHATRLVGVAQDVTENKKLEKNFQEQRAETESIFKQQVAARTASAIAHELNQPLAALSAYSEVALHALNDANANPDQLKHALEGCVAQAQRAGTSLHELLAFLHQGEIVTEQFNLNDIVRAALNIAKGDGYKEFHPTLELEQNMPAVLGNRIQVQKVLVNLLRNAVEAMRGAGVPSAAITVTVRTNKDLNMGHVTVQDSGPGVSQEMVKRIFEPFFTTKPTGIGMGLAISRALIEANGGQLWLEPYANKSNSKTGAAFHFTLPFAS
ncbi:MAG: PAS domain S-box protein [Methylotenera sp.]